ncbi:MAG: nuclear transport factor 2 family protein [Myxococcota bacterium]
MHSNEKLLRDLVAAFQTHDFAKIVACFDPEVAWRWLGTEFLTDIEPGTYVGIQDVAATLTGIDSKITDYKIDRILAASAGDRIGVVWMACSYVDEDGTPQSMEENWVFLFENDVISEVWDYSRMVFLEKVRAGELNS